MLGGDVLRPVDRSGQIENNLVELKLKVGENETSHDVNLFSCFQGPHGFHGPKVRSDQPLLIPQRRNLQRYSSKQYKKYREQYTVVVHST